MTVSFCVKEQKAGVDFDLAKTVDMVKHEKLFMLSHMYHD